jgi:hypothetical protein
VNHLWLEHPHVIIPYLNHMWQYHILFTCGKMTYYSHVAISHMIHMWQNHILFTCGKITYYSHVAKSHMIHMWQYHIWFTCGNITYDSHVLTYYSHVNHICSRTCEGLHHNPVRNLVLPEAESSYNWGFRYKFKITFALGTWITSNTKTVVASLGAFFTCGSVFARIGMT